MRFFKKMRFLPLGVNFMVVDFWGNGVFFFTPVDYIFGVSLYWKIYPRTITLPQLASNGSYSSREQPPTPYRIYTLDITLETWVISESCVCRWVVVLHGGMSPGSAIFLDISRCFSLAASLVWARLVAFRISLRYVVTHLPIFSMS